MSDEIQRIDNNGDHKRENMWEIAQAAMADCDNIHTIVINYVTPSSTVTEVCTSNAQGIRSMDATTDYPMAPKQLEFLSDLVVSVKDVIEKMVIASGTILDADGDGVPDAIDNNRAKTPIAELDDKIKELGKLKHLAMAGVLFHALFGQGGLMDKLSEIAGGMAVQQSQVGYIFDPMQNKGAGDIVKGVGAIDS